MILASAQTVACNAGACHLASTSVGVAVYIAAGATLIAAVFAALFAFLHEHFKNRLRRAGIARLLYHRLLTHQSTLATAFHTERWWPEDELQESDLDADDLKRVATALRSHEWRTVNSALGWTDSLRSRRKGKHAMLKLKTDELETISKTYEKLEMARWALRRVCSRWQLRRPCHKMPWDIHNQESAVSCQGHTVTPGVLKNVSPQECKRELKKRKRDDRLDDLAVRPSSSGQTESPYKAERERHDELTASRVNGAAVGPLRQGRS